MDQQATPPAGWRGGGATRLEAFVDAAFAFAVTLLVISADRVPDSVRALVLALKQVPAFAAGFALLALFWYAHVRWSRNYRLDGMLATLLSLLLVFLVLVYVYPLRLLFGTFFAWVTGGWLPMPLSDFSDVNDVVLMFIAYGVAFASMSACIAGLYVHAWNRRQYLKLTPAEAADVAGEIASYLFFVLSGVVSVLVAWSLPDQPRGWQVAMPGFVYFLLSFTGWINTLGQRWGLRRLRAHKAKG